MTATAPPTAAPTIVPIGVEDDFTSDAFAPVVGSEFEFELRLPVCTTDCPLASVVDGAVSNKLVVELGAEGP